MNQFEGVVAQLRQLPREEIRKDGPGYVEFVMGVKDLRQLYPLLEDFFGPPFKPAGVVPSKEAQKRTVPYGGIEQQQVLYYKEEGGVSSCAMIWPWRDDVRATVKMAQGSILH